MKNNYGIYILLIVGFLFIRTEAFGQVSISEKIHEINSDDNVTLTASNSGTYSWAPSESLNTSTGAEVTASPTTTTTYKVTGTDGSGTTSQAMVVVVVDFEISANPEGAVSSGGSTQLSVSGGATSYSWAPSTGLNPGTGATVTCSPTASVTYTVTGTWDGGSTLETTIEVAFQDHVEVETQLDVENAKYTLTATGAASYEWAPSDYLDPTTGSVVTAEPTKDITYTVTGIAANGTSTTATVKLSAIGTPPASTYKPPVSLADTLNRRYNFALYKDSKNIYNNNNLIYIFLDTVPDKFIDNTYFPSSLYEHNGYHYRIVTASNNVNDRFIFTITGQEYVEGGLIIQQGASIDAPSLNIKQNIRNTDDSKGIYIHQSEDYGPFSKRVCIKAQRLRTREDGGIDTIEMLNRCIHLYNQPYHVSIMGGAYYSTLNNPDNIKNIINSNGDSTLAGDNTSSQIAITVMAVFYPWEREPNYHYRDLSFEERWSICFGLKISQNPFSDLFAGLNYEFARGASLSAGVHYGQHKVVVGYKNFKYGTTVYHGNFTNDNLRLQYEFAYFAGFNIDLAVFGRLVSFSRQNYNNTTESNKEGNNDGN